MLGALFITIQLVLGCLTFFFGQIMLYRLQTSSAQHVTPYVFVWRQLVLHVMHPTHTLMVLFGCLLAWPFLVLLTLIDPRFFDPRETRVMAENDELRRAWEERHGQTYRPYQWESTAIEHSQWENSLRDRETNTADYVRDVHEGLARSSSWLVLFLSILSAPIMFFIKKAHAGEREEEAMELLLTDELVEKSGFRPSGPDVHGFLLMRYDVESFFASPTPTLSLANARFVVRGQPAKRVNYLVVAEAATWANGGGDTLLAAQGSFTASDRLSLTVGRVLTMVGFSRQPLPSQLVPITYADTFVTTPFVDHGLIATWNHERVSLNMGVVTGNGTALDIDVPPDIVVRGELSRNDLLLGGAAQSGRQVGGWRHVGTTYLSFDIDRLLLQAEISAAANPVDDGMAPGIGWWSLAAVKITEVVQPYARVSSTSTGNVNVAPTSVLAGLNIHLDPVVMRAGVDVRTDASTSAAHLATQLSF